MLFRSDEDDDLPSNEPPLPPLDRLPYARRLVELIRTPPALERWRQQCHTSFQECRQRHDRLKSWQQERHAIMAKARKRRGEPPRKPPKPGWKLELERVFLRNGKKSDLVWAWVPPEYQESRRPYAGGPLPFSSRHALSLADCYFVLAVIHDAERRDGRRINRFAPNDGEELAFLSADGQEWTFWYVTARHASGLQARDQLTLDDCLARVEADLNGLTGVAVQTGEEPRRRNPSRRGGRDIQKGEARAKIIAALTKHHAYDDGGTLNLEPISVSKLAKMSKAGKASASRFFKNAFGGHSKYSNVFCRAPSRLAAALKHLRGEYTPDKLFGGTPPSEGSGDKE